MPKGCTLRGRKDRAAAKKCLILAALTLALVLLFFASPAGTSEQKEHKEELFFTILHTNDEHSSLLPHFQAVDFSYDHIEPVEKGDNLALGGFARLATAIEQIRQEKREKEEPVLLFNAGDFLGGAIFGWLTPYGYSPEIMLLQEMGYDAVIIGNHEFDYGPDTLADYLLRAGYPEAHEKTVVLAANTRTPEDHPLASRQLYLQDKIFHLDNGLKVGVFGLIGEDAVSVTADTGDVEFLDQIQTAREALSRLKEQGADVIVAITHSGLEEDRLLAAGVPGIDVIVGGHCHTALFEPVVEGGTIIVQAGSLGKYLGRLELAYNPGSGSLRIRNDHKENPFLIPVDDRFAPHPAISSRVDDYKTKLDELVYEMTRGRFEDVLGTTARSEFVLLNQPPLQESPAGNFITDAMRLVTEEVMGEKVYVAVQANGSIRGSIVPVGARGIPGEVSFYDIAGVIGLGYGNDGYPGYAMVSCYLTGEEILRLLEVAVLLQELQGDTYFLQFSGLRYNFNPQNAVLFTVPLIDQPLPTTRAVSAAELYTGEGVQPVVEGEFLALEKGDDHLYLMVTDTYIFSFLPVVGTLLPRLEIVPKNAAGEPVPLERIEELVVRYQDRELKVWEAVVMYAASLSPGEDGVPLIPDGYRGTAGRINQVTTFPLVAWVYMSAAMVVTGTAFLARRIRRIKKKVKEGVRS